MASKTFVSPLIRHVTTRGYAQAAPASLFSEPKIQSAVLPNQTLVTAYDNGSPLTRITIAFKAGSRFEPQSELGISHMLRASAGLSTQCGNTFIMARQLAQVGATLSASGDREFIYYTLETTKENLQTAIEQVNNIVSKQEFRSWELEDNLPRIKYELVALPPQVRAIDLLHKAAFRRGLGNSLFISPKRIGKISSESIQHFAANTVTPNRCSIAVVGDTQDRGNLVAQCLQLPSTGDAKPEPSRYYGGELRKEMGGDLAHVAIALQGAPAGSKQSLALAIAAKALGNGPVTKWGSDNSPLAKTVGNIGPFAAAGFNVSYSDSGLFGVVLSVPKDEANSAVKVLGALLKKPALNATSVQAGKNQLKMQVLSEAEDGASLAESLAAQAFYLGGGAVKSPLDLAKEIDQISNGDISAALSQAAQSKISMGCAGNLAFVPYADEL